MILDLYLCCQQLMEFHQPLTRQHSSQQENKREMCQVAEELDGKQVCDCRGELNLSFFYGGGKIVNNFVQGSVRNR